MIQNLENKMELDKQTIDKDFEDETFLSSDCVTKQQSSTQNVLSQKQRYRSMEQNRKPRDKFTLLWAPYL